MKDVTEHIEKLQSTINILEAIRDIEGINFVNGSGIFFWQRTYKENLKLVKEIEKRTGRALSLASYYESGGRLVCVYEGSDGVSFLLYCIDLRETLELFGCKMTTTTYTTTETEVVCSNL